jgi:hypothetical protein
MNSGEANTLDMRRLALLARFQAIDMTLRTCLHKGGMNAIVRAHLERAIAHIREAHIAVNENIEVRTVQELASQLARIDEMREDLRAQEVLVSSTTQSPRI